MRFACFPPTLAGAGIRAGGMAECLPCFKKKVCGYSETKIVQIPQSSQKNFIFLEREIRRLCGKYFLYGSATADSGSGGQGFLATDAVCFTLGEHRIWIGCGWICGGCILMGTVSCISVCRIWCVLG